MIMKTKIEGLVRKGYTQSAFRNKSNASRFSSLWRKKGYRISTLRSSGPTVEGGYKNKAYYVIATKVKRKPVVRRRRIARNQNMGWNVNWAKL